MGILGVATAVGLALLLTANRTAQVGETTSAQLARRDELARQFREDVGRAKNFPEQAGQHKAGPECLILALADGATVVYERANDVLNRIERKGETESTRQLPFGAPETKVQFVRPKDIHAVATLRLTETRNRGTTMTSEYSAAPGGDLR
jgi:hypothetical protein